MKVWFWPFCVLFYLLACLLAIPHATFSLPEFNGFVIKQTQLFYGIFFACLLV
jgi:hypothetical protein